MSEDLSIKKFMQIAREAAIIHPVNSKRMPDGSIRRFQVGLKSDAGGDCERNNMSRSIFIGKRRMQKKDTTSLLLE